MLKKSLKVIMIIGLGLGFQMTHLQAKEAILDYCECVSNCLSGGICPDKPYCCYDVCSGLCDGDCPSCPNVKEELITKELKDKLGSEESGTPKQSK